MTDDVVGMFLYGLRRLTVDDNGLTPDNDPDDLQTMGALSVLVYRLMDSADTPFDAALSRLAVLTGALLASVELGHGDEIIRKWVVAKSEVLDLQLAANT